MLFSLNLGGPSCERKVNVHSYEFNYVYTEDFIAYEVYEGLFNKEGTGDTLTTVPTGDLGVTRTARKATDVVEGTPDTDTAILYLLYLEDKWERVKGYEDAPKPVKMALLDSSYNLGERVMRYRSTTSALAKGSYIDVMQSLLNSVNVKGKSVRGLAKRRAELYNWVAEDKITSIEQQEDGTILYKVNGGVLFKHKPKGGRHEKSNIGIIIMPDYELQHSRYG